MSAKVLLRKKTWIVVAFMSAVMFTFLLRYRYVKTDTFYGSTSSPNNTQLKKVDLGEVKHLKTDDGSTGGDVISGDFTCKFPDVDPFNPDIIKLAGVGQKTLTCDDGFMPEITYIDQLSIKVNTSKINKTLGFSYCVYRNITRPDFKDNNFTVSDWSLHFTKYIALTSEHEFIHVECRSFKYNNSRIVSTAFYSLVPIRKHLDKLYETRLKKRHEMFRPTESLNIIIVALDGVPRHQMLRGMPKSYSYLTKDLNSFDFTMHSQVEDNTFPNMLALLSGNLKSRTKKWWGFSKPQDPFDLIWHDFERAGYRTLYTEDNPKGAGFYWKGRSFVYPQTSYWNRPLELAMLAEKGFIRQETPWCAGQRPISEYQLDYLLKFLNTFHNKPVACQTFIIKLTHDDATKASQIDEHILNFYKALNNSHHLNKSLVLFLSDHGQRWGSIRQTYNGIVESRNPFLLLTLPPWFLKRYSDIAHNLEINTGRLTTHFDTYQMLLDTIYFGSTVPTPIYRGEYGISLFKEIPADRNCSDAAIPSSQCLCGQNVQSFLETSSETAKSCADALVDAVRSRSDKDKCENYDLENILHVGVLSMPAVSSVEKRRHRVYNVRLTVKPGGAMFEGTVYVDSKSQKITVGENVERLNMYKGEVECRPTSQEQMYCYCKGNKLPS